MSAEQAANQHSDNRQVWQGLYKLMRLDKPIGILLLLWPTYWALWSAKGGVPSLPILIVFSLGVLFMRSAGCVINDFADRKVDGHVKRTCQRPLVSGQVKVKEALALFFALILVSFLLVLTLNNQTILLSFVAVALATLYPFMKRWTYLPQFVLGAAFAWAIPMAFSALEQLLSLVCWLLYAATLLWTVAYDTMYAMVDRDDDLKVGIKSTAILFGRFDKLIIGFLQLTVLVIFIVVGDLLQLSFAFYICLIFGAFLFIYQQYLISGRTREKCFRAFLNNQYFGALVFAGLALG